MEALGATVSYLNEHSVADGAKEYYDAVVGASPKTTAMRRGQWYAEYLGPAINNHIRAGWGMASVP
jgi:hypothetical protein